MRPLPSCELRSDFESRHDVLNLLCTRVEGAMNVEPGVERC